MHEEQSKRMPRSLTPLLTLLFTAREATDPKNNQCAGIAERLVTFVIFVQRTDMLTNLTKPPQPSSVLKEDDSEYAFLPLEPHLIERSRS